MVCCHCGCTCRDHTVPAERIIVIGDHAGAAAAIILALGACDWLPTEDSLAPLTMAIQYYDVGPWDFAIPDTPNNEPFAGHDRELSPWAKKHRKRDMQQNQKYLNKNMRNNRYMS